MNIKSFKRLAASSIAVMALAYLPNASAMDYAYNIDCQITTAPAPIVEHGIQAGDTITLTPANLGCTQMATTAGIQILMAIPGQINLTPVIYTVTAVPFDLKINAGPSNARVSVFDISSGSAPPIATPTSIPTLSEWGMIILSMLIGGFGVYQHRRRQS